MTANCVIYHIRVSPQYLLVSNFSILNTKNNFLFCFIKKKKNFEVEEVRRLPINRFGKIETLYNINYDTLMMSFEEADALIKAMLKEFVRAFTARMQDNDMIAVVFVHDDFGFSITIPFMKKKYFTVEVIQEAFFRLTKRKNIFQKI
jgi:hypothetical protein